MLEQVGATKSLSMKGYVPSVVIKLRTKPISNYIVRDIPRLETYSFLKLKQKFIMFENHHMKVISQLMNSNDYYVNLRLSSHVIVL